MIKFIKLVLFIVLVMEGVALLNAQEPVEVKRSDNKIVLEGKIYYVHTVRKGQTLYSIANAYNQTEKAIIIENPGAASGLIIGQVLKIPTEKVNVSDINTAKLEAHDSTHVMKKGETIYSISRKYNCKPEDILELNPGLVINNIPIGASINVPYKIDKEVEKQFDEQGDLFHRVKTGETLNSIAKYYSTNVRAIRRANPELLWSRTRSGDVLKIPQSDSDPDQVFMEESVDLPDQFISKESPFDTSDIQEYNYEEFEDFNRKRDVYNIVYLIPFNYKKMEPLDSILKDVTSEFERKRKTEDYMLEEATPKSINALEFMEGCLLAIDSATDKGMKLSVSFFDTKRSPENTRELLEREELQRADLIIGPFYPFNIEIVSDFSRRHRIPLVNPFGTDDSLIWENPYLIQAVPSNTTELNKNAEYIGRSYDANLIFIHSADSARMNEIKYYKNQIFKELKKYSANESVLFKEVVITDGNTDNLIQALNPDMKNLVIMPSIDEAFSSQVASKLFYELQNFDIEVIGSSYWHGFDDIELEYIHALTLIVPHTQWYSYSNPDFQSFMRSFRKSFINEPRVYTRRGYNFGVVGYDLSRYFLSALNTYGKRFIVNLTDFNIDHTLSTYKYERVSRSGGFENKFMNYYLFDKNLEVKVVDLPEKAPMHHYMRPAGIDPVYFQWSQPVRRDSTIDEE